MIEAMELASKTKPLAHQILYGDCRTLLSAYRDKFDFIFADPPFNISHGYDGYDDNIPAHKFRQFMCDWIIVAINALRDGGTLAIHVPDDLVEMVFDTCQHRQEVKRVDWIILHQRFGQAKPISTAKSLIHTKHHCLIYVKGDTSLRTFNPPRQQSDRATKYGDKRTQATATPGERVAFDVWRWGETHIGDIFGFPEDGPHWGRVPGNSKERRGSHPNQLCENYLARLISAYSNPGDFIADPFCGSGTTCTVAKALGRSCVTMDVSMPNVLSARERLEKGAVRV